MCLSIHFIWKDIPFFLLRKKCEKMPGKLHVVGMSRMKIVGILNYVLRQSMPLTKRLKKSHFRPVSKGHQCIFSYAAAVFHNAFRSARLNIHLRSELSSFTIFIIAWDVYTGNMVNESNVSIISASFLNFLSAAFVGQNENLRRPKPVYLSRWTQTPCVFLFCFFPSW